MKAIIYFLLSICLFKITLEQCFTENPSGVDECKAKKQSGRKCCYVEYRNNKNPNYTSLCVEIINKDIKDGHHEATIIEIENGNYTGSNWTENVMEKFRDYSSIDNFDCKGNFISKSIFLFSCFLILFFI